MAQPRIAFCTTCKGRASHVEKTLPRNLADNEDYQNCVFVILDYNSPDHLLEYLVTHHQSAINSGRLVVYSHKEPGPFRMAHAKNMAHRLGLLEGADVLVNMDADNWSSPGFATWIAEQYTKGYDLMWTNAKSISGRARQGLAGRIAVTRDVFLKSGGYDERYTDWAPEDEDFKVRLRRFGFKGIQIGSEYLYVIPHRDGLRFKEYPHAKPTAETEAAALKAVRESDNRIANFGRFGCGLVHRMDNTEFYLKPLPTRIFGIGMHKTATTSLDAALKVLGFDSAHWIGPWWAKAIWDEMATSGRSLTVEKHYALCDVPIGILYRELDKAYPGSKFILTKRNEAQWLQSVKNHWGRETNKFRDSWDTDCFSHRMHSLIYGRKEFDPDIFLARYRSHEVGVRWYFRDRPNDLLVMDMDRVCGWSGLCEFLDKPIPSVAYPRAYVTEANMKTGDRVKYSSGWPIKSKYHMARRGSIVGVTNAGCVKVKWDDCKAVETVALDSISVVPQRQITIADTEV